MMEKVNQVKKYAKELVHSAPIEVLRLCPMVVMVELSTYDAIDGPTPEERKAREELKSLVKLARAKGYAAWMSGYACVIDSALRNPSDK